MRIQDKTKIYDIKKGGSIRIYIEIYEIIYLKYNHKCIHAYTKN